MKNREKHDDKSVYEMYEMYGGKNGILRKEGQKMTENGAPVYEMYGVRCGKYIPYIREKKT